MSPAFPDQHRLATPLVLARVRRAAWAMALAASAAPAAAAPLPQATAPADSPAQLATHAAQQELQAIRKALVDEALDGPTRVRAWAWVDGRGALHERNEVSADMRVRGVRVREYVEKEQKPLLSIQAKQAVSATGQCRYAQGHWRLPMSVEIDLGAVRMGEMRQVALTTVETARQAWAQALQLGKRYQTAARQVDSLNPYQRALLGAVDTETGWRAVWSVRASEVAQMPFGYIDPARRVNVVHPAKPNVADVVLSLKVLRERRDGRHAAQEQLWSRSQALRVELTAAGWSLPQLTVDSQQQLSALAQAWGHELEQQAACEPLQYDVTDVQDKALRINGGTAAGLQVGDRVVVMDAATVASQVWDTGSLEKVAIARVQQVDAYGAYVQAVQGQLPASDGRLVALPY